MSPEERDLLRKSVGLAEENNEILRSMQRSMRLGRIMTGIYWLFIIGSAVGAYYVVQPYLNQIRDLYDNAKSNFGSFNSLMDKLRQSK